MWVNDLLILYEINKMIRFAVDSGLISLSITPKSFTTDIFTSQDQLAKELLTLIDKEDYNAAENLLFSRGVTGDKEHLGIGVEFYQYLSRLPLVELEEVDFSLEEVEEGLIDFMEAYGIHIFRKNTEEER